MKRRKNGVPTLSVPTDLFARDTMKAIIEASGAEALTVLLSAVLSICDCEGYYLSFDDAFVDYTAGRTGVEPKKVASIISHAIRLNIFDACIFEKYGVLTNRDLQKQYASHFRTRRRPMIIEQKVWLIGREFGKLKIEVQDTIMDKKQSSFTEGVEKKKKVECKKIAEAWNEVAIGSGIPKVLEASRWSSSRRDSVVRLAKKHGTEGVLEAIKKVGESDFLIGKNDRGWVCRFDWLMNPKNFEKVIEGNYDNRGASRVERRENFIDLSEYL